MCSQDLPLPPRDICLCKPGWLSPQPLEILRLSSLQTFAHAAPFLVKAHLFSQLLSVWAQNFPTLGGFALHLFHAASPGIPLPSPSPSAPHCFPIRVFLTFYLVSLPSTSYLLC